MLPYILFFLLVAITSLFFIGLWTKNVNETNELIEKYNEYGFMFDSNSGDETTSQASDFESFKSETQNINKPAVLSSVQHSL